MSKPAAESLPPPSSAEASAAPASTAPPMGLREAEALVRRLMPALQRHGQWITHIHTTLICRTPPRPEDLAVNSHLQTEMGRWFAEEDEKYILRHPQHRVAYESWLEQHARARALCRAVAANEPIPPADYEAFADSIRRFDDTMEVLVRELWDLLLHTDPLTGIATRTGMLPHLRAAHERTRHAGHACSICMIDLDHFKSINDAYGHAAGDRVLSAVSAFLVRNLRHNDHVCRYGGEEFVLMLPNTDPPQALELVERLRRELTELPVVLDDGRILHVTASFGIAPMTPEHSVRETIAMADQAMYAAKQAGRNQVCVWQDA
ncbi:MAG: diguanylate cyclase [Rhodospirillales bacterium]|jgi:diguanylate cyclase (GGDEF)-like protein|nr:diguanylate cyclase [Rhodospirillales bacterium]